MSKPDETTAANDVLRAREAELEAALARLLALVDLPSQPADALALALQLNRVVGQWRTLLVLRDRTLYAPAMHGGPARAGVAAACRQQMDALAEQVEAFAARWSSSALIAIAFPSFRASALVLLATILAQLDRERHALADPVTEQGASLAA